MICSSRAVPSVATTSACVSPRVNSAEPWVRGSTPVRMRDRAHGARVAAVDARLAGEDLVAHDLRFEVEHDVARRALLVRASRRPARTSASTFGDDFLQPLLARLLAADLVGGAQVALGRGGDLVDQRLVLRRRLPVPQRLAALPRRARGSCSITACCCWWPNTTAPSITSSGSSLRFGFDHQHGGFGAGDDEVELRRRELGLASGLSTYWPFDVADARGADRAVERHAGQRERGRRADHRRDVGIDLRIDRHHRRDDLHFVVEAVGEQRADRPVDQARGQRLLLGGAAFALEEAAGDLARGVGLFLVVDGEREEVLARLGVTCAPTAVTSTTVSSRLTSTAPPAWRAISPVSSVSV